MKWSINGNVVLKEILGGGGGETLQWAGALRGGDAETPFSPLCFVYGWLAAAGLANHLIAGVECKVDVAMKRGDPRQSFLPT